MATNNARIVNLSKLSDILGAKETEVYRWARQGTIPAIRLPNKSFIFDLERVEAVLLTAGQQEAKDGH